MLRSLAPLALALAARAAPAAPSCGPAAPSYDALAASYGKTWTLDDLGGVREDFLAAAVMEQACLDAAAGASGACAGPYALFDALDDGFERPHDDPKSGRPRPVRDHCVLASKHVQFVEAAAKGPEDFKRRCLAAIDEPDARKREAACAAAAGLLGKPKAAAERLSAMLGGGGAQAVDTLERDFSMFSGLSTPRRCASDFGSHNPPKTEICAAAYAFRRARAEGISGCGTDALCRALMGGGPNSCAPYARRARAIYCRAAARAR